MRKAQKQQAEDFIKILGEAHDEIRKAIEKKNISAALSLLADCQDGAIALGNLIEAAEGEGFATIALLESYCEQVYQIYGELEKGQPIAVGKTYKSLRQMLFKIESSVKNDIRIRTEVVFLPYKASMWDSLESIWKAADEDPDCDAYVIPIPYYDKNPDGSFRELHYEGGEYPKDVPVVWYEDYDFETRRPDMVFIHNPYDECNIVTSVHPFFYSKNLKKFTDKLVYVPYFILGEIDPEDRQALKDIEKFCLVPGVAYADQVIVQSEDMRQAYVNVLTEFMSGQGRSRAYWEKKILGLGSPKVDKVLSTRKEDLEIPEEWMKVIRKADGSWKKVIFYNTTVTALLYYNEQYLVKMRDVFQIFYENRDEVALLWRPHPLFGATIESMRPELGEEYRRIVKDYRRDGWGIYDDSSDMNRAVVLSDGYYGDMSSVVHLYQTLRKRFAVQSIRIQSNKDLHLSCADIVCYNGKMFILTRDTQSLFEYCPKSGKVKLCGTVTSNFDQLYISMALCNSKLYIVPYNADEISIYDIEMEAFERLPVGQLQHGLLRRHYHLCFNYKDNIYLMGSSGSAMLCLDVANSKIKDMSRWIHEFAEKYCHEAAVSTHMNICIVEDCFWVALNSDNVLLQYNMQTDEYKFWNVGTRRIQYVTVSFDGDYFWLSGDQRFIVRWKKENNEVKEYDGFPDGFECGNKKIGWKELFLCSHLWNDNLYFAPLNSNMVISINRTSGEMECVARIEESQICLKMIKMDKGIYIEIDSYSGNLVEQSYLIDSDNTCQLYPIEIKRDSEVVLSHGIIQGCDVIRIESHPYFILNFMMTVRSEGVLGAFQESKGIRIYKQIEEK